MTLSNVGGRSTFQNAGATRRRGLEAAWSADLRENLRAQVAYTWLDARYRDAFSTCTVTPCTAPNLTIPAGNRIPGIARESLYGALGWAPPQGWRGGVEARALSKVCVNDAQHRRRRRLCDRQRQRSAMSPASARSTLTGFARIDNLFESPLRRLGDRQRRQRALLRAGADAQLDRRPDGGGRVLAARRRR